MSTAGEITPGTGKLDWKRIEPGLRARWGIQRMGKVKAIVRVQNYEDVLAVERGVQPQSSIRTVEIEGIVDTGASLLCLQPGMIQNLGLSPIRTASVQTANGMVTRRMFGGAMIQIGDRSTQMAVMETDDRTPVLIGCVVLEMLDYVVDPKGERIIPNPDHGNELTYEIY
jgi:predicted aspartyl protease